MSMLLDMHEARKARLLRMGMVPPPRHKPGPAAVVHARRVPSQNLTEAVIEEATVAPPEMPPVTASRRRQFGYVGIYSPSWRSILKAVCLKHGVSPRDVLSASRLPNVVECRYEAMREVYARTHMSLQQIGHCFGRHHTTVIAALDKGEVAA